LKIVLKQEKHIAFFLINQNNCTNSQYIKYFMKCPCCSGYEFEKCCDDYLNKNIHPEFAEQLMRSRFTAYALNNAPYIVRTYVQNEQPNLNVKDIEQWAKENKWIKLTVHQTNYTIQPVIVEFSAFYINNNQLIEMREISNFVKEEQWKYLNGEIIKHDVVLSLSRNDICPCNSGKKYKKCCGK